VLCLVIKRREKRPKSLAKSAFAFAHQHEYDNNRFYCTLSRQGKEATKKVLSFATYNKACEQVEQKKLLHDK
jgi:hypothetical protein